MGLAAASVSVGLAAAQEGAALKVGDKAPDFTVTASDGKQYRLQDFKGKSAVAIAWYPKALTGG